MKILFVDQIANVNNKYSFSLIERLKDKHEVLFVSDERVYEDSKVKVYNEFIGITDKNKNKINKAFTYLKAWKKIYKLCKEEKPEILHVQWFILSPIDAFYIRKIRKMGVKIVVTVHDIVPFNEKFYDHKSHEIIYNIADHIIVQAKPNIDRINNMFKGISNKVVYIPHGNFVDHINILPKKVARELLDIDLNKKVILFFGQIKKVKGLDILIKAYNEFIKENKAEDTLLLIAGKVWEDDFEKYQQLIDKVDNTKIRCDIKYIPDEEICWYYCAADINVLPYREVYQSGVVHLACAYEKAVIATNVGSFPEVIIDGETGILIEKDNCNELKDAISELIYQNDRLIDMGKLGKRHIEDNFSWEKIAKDIEKLYRD